MEGGGKAAIEELLTCEKCTSAYAVHSSKETGRVRLMCSSCGDARDLVVTPSAAGRWLLVDPGGRVSQYGSFGELIGSRPSLLEEPVPRSGSSLLDVTPTPVAPSAGPKLALADSDREIEAAQKSVEDEEPISSRDFVEVMRPKVPAPTIHDEDEPLSTRDFVQVVKPDPAARVSRPPPIPPDRASDRASIPADRGSQPAPPPPARGSLKTLPPSAPELPPPTISVDDAPKSRREKRESSPASARPSMVKDDKPTSFLLPLIGIAAAGAIVYVLTRDSGKKEDPPPVAPAPSAAATAGPSGTASTAPPASASASAASAPSSEPSAAPSSSASASEIPAEPRRPVDINTLSLSELLERAAAARRGGDRTRAKELYEKALERNPGNAEAYAGLGDVARSSGDLAAAKDAFQKALATSPSYYPAQLGLADIEWDQGDRASARQRYTDLANRGGVAVPARVRERLGDAPEP